MSQDLPQSHCKFCNEEAQDCECSRGKPEWMQHYEYGLPYGAGYNDGWKEAQKKLLEHLSVWASTQSITPHGKVFADKCQSMLKQLEGQK